MKASFLWRALTWCVLVFVFGMTVYRAKTQSIGHDEAYEYYWFLYGGVGKVLGYTPGNHVLFTLLAKPIVWKLGVSELTLRAPSLLGTVIYLLAAYLLCRQLFGQGILLLLSVAMLCLNPQVLDFMLAARGYILGLAGLATAMYAMARLVEKGEFNPEDKAWKWGCFAASAALALSVTANFTNVVPAACLALTFSLVAMGGFKPLVRVGDRKLRDFVSWFLVPGAVTGFCLLWPYLIQFKWAPNKTHFDKATLAARDVFNASFLYRWTDDVFNVLGAMPPPAGSWQEKVSTLGAFVLFPLLFLLVGVGLFLATRGRVNSRDRHPAQCEVFAGAAVCSVLLILFLHVVMKIDYPFSRYCLFLIPLFTVGAMLASREIYSRFPRSYLGAVGMLIAILVIFDYGLSLQVTQLRYNAYDVISRELYQTIANDAQRRGLTSVRVGGTWWYQPEIDFYRIRYKATWMAEYDVKDKSYFWQSPGALEPSEYDYFVFTRYWDPGLRGPRVRTIFEDNKTGATIVANER